MFESRNFVPSRNLTLSNCNVLQVNDNGVISFNSRYNVRTPLSLPLRGTQQIIAPYWADVDTRGTGQVLYRQSTDPSLLARASGEIQTALSLTRNIEIKNLLITTWNAVGYYFRNTDKVHTHMYIYFNDIYMITEQCIMGMTVSYIYDC